MTLEKFLNSDLLKHQLQILDYKGKMQEMHLKKYNNFSAFLRKIW